MAQYPDPPEASLDAAIQRWKLTNATPENEEVKPNLGQYGSRKIRWLNSLASIHRNDFIVIGMLQKQLRQRGRQQFGMYLYNH